jgi:mevalonate kinase
MSNGGDCCGIGTSHAKAILFGEHAVVYGAPAIAIPLHTLTATARVRSRPDGLHLDTALFRGRATDVPDRIRPVVVALQSALDRTGRSDQGLDLLLESTIPYERGLGSSAAVAVAIARAVYAFVGTPADPAQIDAIALDSEMIAHGSSSGLDGRTVASEAPIHFRAGRTSPVAVGSTLTLVLADTGHAGSTAESVGSVRLRLQEAPVSTGGLIDRLGQISEQALPALADGDVDALGALMDEAQQHLTTLGVSDESIRTLVAAAHEAHAAGAKLTGGGRGGCVIALAHDATHADRLETRLRAAGAARTWQTRLEAA